LLQHCQRDTPQPRRLRQRRDIGGIGSQHGDGTATTDPPRGQATTYPLSLLMDILPAEPYRIGEGASGQVPW
jgi:hypothetical protein